MFENNELTREKIFINELHLQLDGLVNKQNWRICESDNPYVCESKHLHSVCITALAAVNFLGFFIEFMYKKITGKV